MYFTYNMFTYNLLYIYLVLLACTTVYGTYQYTYECIMICKSLHKIKTRDLGAVNKTRVVLLVGPL